jgi:glutaryl-CoA dehydrogenase
MPAFPGVDFLDFDSLLNDEELLARKTARQFVDEQVLPIIVKHNREGTLVSGFLPHGSRYTGANVKQFCDTPNLRLGSLLAAILRFF